jgi:hypothetical protein
MLKYYKEQELIPVANFLLTYLANPKKYSIVSYRKMGAGK